jgi:hypothetical protein
MIIVDVSVKLPKRTPWPRPIKDGKDGDNQGDYGYTLRIEIKHTGIPIP